MVSSVYASAVYGRTAAISNQSSSQTFKKIPKHLS